MKVTTADSVTFHVVNFWSIISNVGHGDSNTLNVPTRVRQIEDVAQVACGSSHTLALTTDGRVWSFGGGDHGTIVWICDVI